MTTTVAPANTLVHQAHARGEHRRFFGGLALVVASGLVLRVGYVLSVTRHENGKIYDALYYELQGYALSLGQFFPQLFGFGPDAAHPPLTSISLVPVTYLFGLPPGFTPQRMTMAVVGAAVIALVGILGRTLAGPGVGLVAAFVAAFYPNMWIPNGIVMSETLAMFTVVLVLLATYRLRRSPTVGNAVLVGLGCGAAILVRAELVLLVPFLLVPAALLGRSVPRPRRLVLVAVGVVVMGLVVGPWAGRNLVSFRDMTILSTGEGPLLLGANCPMTYAGPGIATWAGGWCLGNIHKGTEESVETTHQYNAAKNFISHHLSRLPVVALARVGRVWDFYEPAQMVHTDANEGRPVPAGFAGLFCYWALLPVAALGLVGLRRRGVPVWPLLMIAVLVTVVAATGYGTVRFRAEFEPALVVLAAVGLVDIGRRLRPKRLAVA